MIRRLPDLVALAWALGACGEVRNLPAPGVEASPLPTAGPEASLAPASPAAPDAGATLGLGPSATPLASPEPSASPSAIAPTPGPSATPSPAPLALKLVLGQACLGEQLVVQGEGFPAGPVELHLAAEPTPAASAGALPFARHLLAGQAEALVGQSFTATVPLLADGEGTASGAWRLRVGDRFWLVARYPQGGGWAHQASQVQTVLYGPQSAAWRWPTP